MRLLSSVVAGTMVVALAALGGCASAPPVAPPQQVAVKVIEKKLDTKQIQTMEDVRNAFELIDFSITYVKDQLDKEKKDMIEKFKKYLKD